VELARDGMPFRDAYREAANPKRWEARDAVASLEARVSPGAASSLRLSALRERLQALG
jgi:argininosuccinate lyase